MTSFRLFIAVALTSVLAAGCAPKGIKHATTSTAKSFVRVSFNEEGDGYLIDPNTQSCSLIYNVIETGPVITAVDCGLLAANVDEAAKHITWVKGAAAPVAPAPDALPTVPRGPRYPIDTLAQSSSFFAGGLAFSGSY